MPQKLILRDFDGCGTTAETLSALDAAVCRYAVGRLYGHSGDDVLTTNIAPKHCAQTLRPNIGIFLIWC
jgi:hypothetical protein